MRIIFTKGKNPLSLLIRWALNEPVSHVAIVFDNKIVFHSNLLGCHLKWYKTFSKKAETVFSVDFTGQLNLTAEEEVYGNIIDTFDERGYDFGAFAYFAWRALLLKFFKKPIPEVNKWGSKERFLCGELVGCFPDWLIMQKLFKDLAIVSPFQVYLKLKEYQEQLSSNRK